MNIKELKEYINNLPDDMEVKVIDEWEEHELYPVIENNKLTL